MPSLNERSFVRMTSALALTALATACGGAPTPTTSVTPSASESTESTESTETVTLTLLTHDSFNLSEDVLASFTAASGIDVELLAGGDAGAVLSQAILTKDNPLADVIFGIDNVALGRALDADILLPHPTALPGDIDADADLDPSHRAVPIDRGDVCLNYDKQVFNGDVTPPSDLDALRDPSLAAQLVVQDPSTSSPGLAFLLATIAEYGEDGWQDYWQDLRDGGVTITSGWEDAYYGHFSGGSGEGDRALVVSYASSPAAEVLYGPDPEADEAPTGVVLSSCFQQIEFAGTLAGTAHPAEAAQLIDFLLSDEVQQDIPLQMFVFPVRDVALPDVFVAHAQVATDPYTLSTELIDAHREEWISAWVDLMLR